jgi:release factor glutamine methyltransferase
MSGASATNSEPWTILRLLQWTTEHLKKSGSPSPRLDAEVLLAEARGCQRIELYTAFAEEPPEPIKAKFRELIKRRASGEPVAYLVGKKEFYSLSFRVDRGCLIPRGETEHIVVECLDRIKGIAQRVSDRPIRIVDVCTGSGCIAVAVAKHAPSVEVTAIDISAEAIAIAQSNVDAHGVSDRVRIHQGDLLASVENQSVDFVLSNPPYVSESEHAALDRSVRDHEPYLALVSGPSGTEIVDRLAIEAAQKLVLDGWFLCEFSPMIADRVFATMEQSGDWKNLSFVKDLAGHKRLIAAQRK